MTGIRGESGEDLEILGGTVDDLIYVVQGRADILRLIAEIRARKRSLGGGDGLLSSSACNLRFIEIKDFLKTGILNGIRRGMHLETERRVVF